MSKAADIKRASNALLEKIAKAQQALEAQKKALMEKNSAILAKAEEERRAQQKAEQEQARAEYEAQRAVRKPRRWLKRQKRKPPRQPLCRKSRSLSPRRRKKPPRQCPLPKQSGPAKKPQNRKSAALSVPAAVTKITERVRAGRKARRLPRDVSRSVPIRTVLPVSSGRRVRSNRGLPVWQPLCPLPKRSG